jgi:hypothetical protein
LLLLLNSLLGLLAAAMSLLLLLLARCSPLLACLLLGNENLACLLALLLLLARCLRLLLSFVQIKMACPVYVVIQLCSFINPSYHVSFCLLDENLMFLLQM